EGEDHGLFADERRAIVKEPKDLLSELGLPDVYFLKSDITPVGNPIDLADEAAGRAWRQIASRWLSATSTTVRYVPVKLLGECREWKGIKTVCIPEAEPWTIVYDSPRPKGRVAFADKKGEEHTL